SVIGITLGPFVGAAIISTGKLGWRWIYYVQIILTLAFFQYSGSCTGKLVAMSFSITGQRRFGNKPVGLYTQVRTSQVRLARSPKVSFMRPTKMFVTEPVVVSLLSGLALHGAFSSSSPKV
ncbi:hypothetical protein V1508DRAFT_224798, partial [Lipomyces doorenjongii]|uniref:uncharacterized protein n=1 Tax=Lipomyces doorenjongii TaxID=383834 RepID=UPI0034CFC4C0